MAHVAISKDFIARVGEKIHVMKQAEVNTLGKIPALTVPKESEVLLKAVWGEHLHLRDKVPNNWKNTSESCRLTINTTSTVKNSADEDCPVEYQFSVVAPPNTRFDFPPNGYWHSKNFVPADLLNHADIKQAVDYGNARTEIETRWKGITDKVVTFFHSCKSMKEAVTLWPECLMYIHADDIKRFETKVVKTASADSKAAQVLAGIDTDELVGAAVAARFTGVA